MPGWCVPSRQGGNGEEIVEASPDRERRGGCEQRNARQRDREPAGVGQPDDVGGVVGVLMRDDDGAEPFEPSAAGRG